METLWPFAAINAPALGLLAGFVALPAADSKAGRIRYVLYAVAALALAGIAFGFSLAVPAIGLEIAGIALLAPSIPRPVERPAPTDVVGHAYIVGGGPGDPGLVTLRAAAVLADAEVLLYDALVSDAVVAMAPATCEKIFVGKRRGSYAVPQEEIVPLMVRHARVGKRVVRLKGGDPFVFGRGGEEALGLYDAGIPFEIVPGISSALAVPAYAGIPLTQRGLSASFMVAAGREDPAKPHSQIDWQRLANPEGTAVFLMGLAELADIAARLIAHGRSAWTPVAVIENGTRADQRTIAGTLATIADDVRRAHLTGPTTVVVGEVVRLRERIAWFAPEAQAERRAS